MLSDIPFHIVYSTGENEPIEFFFEALMESTSFDLGLGYFSSSAINVLSAGFAYFIHKGGKMRIIINDVLSPEDKEAIEKGINEPKEIFEENIINDIQKLFSTLSKRDRHFFNCLSYLISKKRIEFIATIPKNNLGGIAHSKYGIFTDENNNKVVFNGSANFSKSALLYNVESISCYKSWSQSENEIERLQYFEGYFNKTWNGISDSLTIIQINKVKSYIQKNFPCDDEIQLMKEEIEINLENNKIYNTIKRKLTILEQSFKPKPSFPFAGGPREYQKEAYKNWIAKNYKGIFAMATGTGKTYTALNCVLNEYNKTNTYYVLILVPTITLVDQWKTEIKKFSFENIIEVSGRTTWRENLTRIKNDHLWGIYHDFFIVTTYASFTDILFQKLLNGLDKEIILIADEAHNIGAPQVKKTFKSFKFSKLIALSATPKRIYDPEGTKEIEYFFDDAPPYCYNFSMKDAIKNEYLTKYFYYPRLLELTESESKRYIQISKRLLQYYNSKSNEFIKSAELEKLLLLRKQIIHKAKNKLNLLKEIISEIKSQKELKYCFIYVPEGYGKRDDESTFSFIEEFLKILYSISPETTTNTFLGGDSDRIDKLKGFSEGKIDVLLAMKCLDEGVDVPRAEIGIFASSTGNPRQYIQRRGRLLRRAKNKQFAFIYDMIVAPNFNLATEMETYNLERNLVKSELTRVAYFASLSENFYESKSVLHSISKYYNLDIDQIINEL